MTNSSNHKSYLLDTQIALWLMLGSRELDEGKFRKRFITDNEDEVSFYFHQISTWEIQIKYNTGKLKLPQSPDEFLIEAVKQSGFTYEKINDQGIFFLGKLPSIHKDPFDRLLIAHAASLGWTIITTDNKFKDYPVKVEHVKV